MAVTGPPESAQMSAVMSRLTAPVTPTEAGPSEHIREAEADDRDVVAHASKAVLALGALGIVYGDLGTSPLYTVQTIFTPGKYHAVSTSQAGVYGIASLIFCVPTTFTRYDLFFVLSGFV